MKNKKEIFKSMTFVFSNNGNYVTVNWKNL